ncbi:hypothetical protein [Methylocystis echinoides]|uniref:hypothetical protein n=1 Tax=Methylocystis echinoides TaxID=29468 RepID=UPI0034377B77
MTDDLRRFAAPGLHLHDEATANAISRGVHDLARMAFETQGMAAFDQTRKAAAIHEAGHAVVARTLGEPVQKVQVWRVHACGAWRWEGFTTYDSAQEWRTDETTSALADAHMAMIFFAGVASEMLFAGDDYKLGSSLDEVVIFNGLAGNVARKSGLIEQELSFTAKLQHVVFRTLKDNEPVVRAIAQKLTLHKVLRRRQLTPLLQPVATNPLKDITEL